MSLLLKAQSEGLIYIHQQKNEIYYAHLDTYLPISPEEQVRLGIYLQLIYHYNYPSKRIVFEYPVKMGSSYKRVDILVFADDAKRKPLIIVECKRAEVGSTAFSEAIEQAFSYDNHLYASYIWVTSGREEAFYKSEHSKNGRKRYALQDVPRFTWKEKLWYKAFEGLQVAWGFLGDVYKEFFQPSLKSKWFARLCLFLVVFMTCNYASSWANIRWLTPYALKNNFLQKGFTFEHLFWVSGSVATFLGMWVLRHSLIAHGLLSGSKPSDKAKQRNNWVLIATILVLIPAYFCLKLFFGYDTKYCYSCKPCSEAWRCWWSFAHFKLYPQNARIWEYLLPSFVVLGVQAIGALLVGWLLKGYASIR